MKLYSQKTNYKNLLRLIRFIKKNGLSKALKMVIKEYTPSKEKDYLDWIKKYMTPTYPLMKKARILVR